ncbi:FadR/GntR family transcriptional regulator [Castellaniella sp.]|uniref:FadR/GntR family transcriptional regulator n=1 Tax=Castellaniella sp. TaxID=1955812 RepID=UPI00355EDB60
MIPSQHPAVVESTRGYLQIAEALRREISRLSLPAGSRLPSERELALRLRVSRPSLREALVVLELQGEIEIRVGSGIYLCQAAARQEAAADVGHAVNETIMGYSPKEVSEMRFFLESGVAAHAARHISRSQIRDLAESLATMRTALERRRGPGDRTLADADRSFHLTLAATADNRLLSQTVSELFDQRYMPIAGSMHRLFEKQTVWDDALQEHTDIYHAVADRDPLQAMAAMQRHLKRAHARLMTVIG